MPSPSTIVAANNLSTQSAAPWQKRIHTFPDGHRLVAAGSNYVSTVSGGTITWATASNAVLAAGDNVICPGMYFGTGGGDLLIGASFSGTGLTFVACSHKNGVFGSVSTIGTITCNAPVQSIRLVWDASFSFAALTGHTAGRNGALIAIADLGTTWQLFAIDINNTGTGSVNNWYTAFNKIVTNPVAGPTSVTNALMRVSGEIIAVSPGSSAWAVAKIVYQYVSGGTSNGFTVTWETNTTLDLPASYSGTSSGCAITPSDTTSSPGVQLFWVSKVDGGLKTAVRYAAGGYSAQQTGNGTGFVSGVSAVWNSNSGTVDVFGLASFSGTNHVGWTSLSGGVWSSWAQFDTNGAAITGFYSGSERSLLTIGPAVVYGTNTTNGTYYYDNGFVAGAVAPNAPTNIMPTGTGVYGSVSPFNVTNLQPGVSFVFQEPNASDPMASVEIKFTHGAGVVDWDTGQYVLTNVAARPLSGQSYSTTWGAIGTAPVSSLTPGTTETLQITTWDATSGQSASASVTVQVWNTPTITGPGPSTFTALQTAITGTYVDGDSLAASAMEFYLIDANNNIVYDSGAITISVTAGSAFSLGPLDFSAAVQAGTVKNNTTYTAALYVSVQPASGPPILGAAAWTVTTAFPAPYAPTALSNAWVLDSMPTNGAYMLSTFQQAASDASHPGAASWNVYTRPAGGGTATLQETVTAIGTGQQRISTFVGVPTTTLDYGISSLSATNVESTITWASAPTPNFIGGIYLGELQNPTNRLRLNNYTSSAGIWDYITNQDVAVPMGRSGALMTVGSAYARQTTTDPTIILDQGYEAAMLTLLRQWRRDGTPLLMRDSYGETHIVAVIRVQESYDSSSNNFMIRTAQIGFVELDDPGLSTLAIAGPA